MWRIVFIERAAWTIARRREGNAGVTRTSPRRKSRDHINAKVALDSSAISYREMALVNAAYARLRAGSVQDALITYREARQVFPRSMMAHDGENECVRLLTNDSAM